MQYAVAAAMMTILAGSAVAAPPANPLLGEWQDEHAPRKGLLGYRHLQFGPDALILDRIQAVTVHGYDVEGRAVRVRTAGLGDLLFVLSDDRLCPAQAQGIHSLHQPPQFAPTERCFVRRNPGA